VFSADFQQRSERALAHVAARVVREAHVADGQRAPDDRDAALYRRTRPKHSGYVDLLRPYTARHHFSPGIDSLEPLTCPLPICGHGGHTRQHLEREHRKVQRAVSAGASP
jgi:hypothetical protein